MKGYSYEDSTIMIDRKLTQLDLFVRSFLDIMKKHMDCLIVSGYVSICTGRTRGTENIDVITPMLDKEKFKRLFDDLMENGFWCYQGDDPDEVYTYLPGSIRFAKTDEMFPNMEFITFEKDKTAKAYEFKNPQMIKIKDFEFKIPEIEFEVAYKEIRLKSKKDLEDARHLREFFSDIFDENQFLKAKKVILDE